MAKYVLFYAVKNTCTLMFVISSLVLMGCNKVCEEKIAKEIKSPNGKYIAVVFEQDCGATAAIQSHINLRRAWGWFWNEPEGHILDGEVFVTRSGEIEATWKNNNSLHISCSGCQDGGYSKSCVSSWKDVSIICETHSYKIQK